MGKGRKIFGPYYDGASDVYADPVRVHRRLAAALGGDYVGVVRDAGSEDDTRAIPALERLLPAIRQAFEMQPFDRTTGQGATDVDCIDVCDAYLEWLEKNDEPAGTPLTCLPPSVLPHGNLPTEAGLGSGLISTAFMPPE